ncbi:hypothetical protein F5888DRAFT_1669998 [Russula emetica]|nr:hypothetical protein F5888DRAFT_1669998 [Russula emetica]
MHSSQHTVPVTRTWMILRIRSAVYPHGWSGNVLITNQDPRTCFCLFPLLPNLTSCLMKCSHFYWRTDMHRNIWQPKPECEGWCELLWAFDNVKTLRVAGRLVEELDKTLKADDKALLLCPGCKRSCDMVLKTSLQILSRFVRLQIHLYACML